MERTWKTKQTTNEDLPLLLRYLTNLDFGAKSLEFPELILITQHLAEVSDNGLPEPDYNDKLCDFDKAIQEAFEITKVGMTVLIETFAGKRNYYIYAIQDADVAKILSNVLQQHPAHEITWSIHPDSTWSFIQKYASQYGLQNEATNVGKMPT